MIGMGNTDESIIWQVIVGERVNFLLVPDFCDLMTPDDLISILICLMIVLLSRILKYKHFKGYSVVL